MRSISIVWTAGAHLLSHSHSIVALKWGSVCAFTSFNRSPLEQQILCKQNKIQRKKERGRKRVRGSKWITLRFFSNNVFFCVCSRLDLNFYRLGNTLHANDAKTFDFHATEYRTFAPKRLYVLSIELKSFPFKHSLQLHIEHKIDWLNWQC